MTFAVSSAGFSGAIGGVNQSVKPNLVADNSFDKILDSRVEKFLSQNKSKNDNKQIKTEVRNVNIRDLKQTKSAIQDSDQKSDVKDESEVKNLPEDKISKIKKLSKKIDESDSLDEKEIDELKKELEILVEVILNSESDITNEEITELTLLLEKMTQVLSEVENKVENFLSLVSQDEDGETKVLSSSKESSIENKLLETINTLKENISNLKEILTEVINDSEKVIDKTEFGKLLDEISKGFEVFKENTQKTLENNPELLKEIPKNTDNTSEIVKNQISKDSLSTEEIKSTTVAPSEDINSSNDSSQKGKEESSAKSEVIVKTSTEENTKVEVNNTDKNVEILKFENTLIRSVKVNNPERAQTFEKNIMKQVINFTTNNIKVSENGSEMILKLKPNNLGEVAVKLAIDKGVVLAEFKVESQAVKEVLESNLANLKTALSDKGFSLSGLNVSVGDNGTNNSSKQSHQGSKNKTKFFDILEKDEDTLNSKTSQYSTSIDTLR